jgi:alkanesulfonate monooxygenase SsuD/methylene tetrahydromethanopterin reductase-like flavin-dependent oxidoreductase (luciferase family)
MSEPLSIGVRVPHELFGGGSAALRRFVADAESHGIDRLVVGDHVSFHGGQGFDGLVSAAALAALSDRVVVQTSVYLLPLRHPVPVARQVSAVAALAPGRFNFGVGVGGEDRSEVTNCGVDPATRGRRMDESLSIVRRLLAGVEVSRTGEFFDLDAARIEPAPAPAVPILVGGRSGAAVRRAARFGDGWLGVWVSPGRFAGVRDEIAALAPDGPASGLGWRHGLLVWCGIGERARAGARLAQAMESLYRVPFSSFERYAPSGPPEAIAEALWPYVEQGCRNFDLTMVTDTPGAALEAATRLAGLLRDELGEKGPTPQ